jgi:hypothetical protein
MNSATDPYCRLKSTPYPNFTRPRLAKACSSTSFFWCELIVPQFCASLNHLVALGAVPDLCKSFNYPFTQNSLAPFAGSHLADIILAVAKAFPKQFNMYRSKSGTLLRLCCLLARIPIRSRFWVSLPCSTSQSLWSLVVYHFVLLERIYTTPTV